MNGIGQEMQVIMPDLQDALMQHSAKQRQFDAANQLAQGGNGWGGIGEILGAALGSYKANKYGGELDKSQADINTQIAQFQEQKAQELAQMEAAKAQAATQQKLDSLIPTVGEQMAKAIVYGGQSLKDLKPEQTSAMQNVAAMGYKPGTPEYAAAINKVINKSNAPVVNVNSGTEYGKIADGMMMEKSPDGSVKMVPIPGSPADKEAKENQTKDIMSGISSFDDGQNIDAVIDKSLKEADWTTTGFIGNLASKFEGSDAFDLKENMKTIEADAAFTTLQNMRKQSKTGGALGAVSEKELGLLSAAKAALSTSQSTEQFKENLQRYQQVRRQAMMNTARAYEMDYGQTAPWMNQEREQPQQSGQQDEYKDGTVIENAQGQRMIKRNGQWVQQ